MNALFHAAAGVALGGLALGDEATGSDLALCAVAGTSPDWDGALLVFGRKTYRQYHRTITHGFLGLALTALAAGTFLSVFRGWDFGLAAVLWLTAAGGHTVSDLFNRSGVALFAPFSEERTRFPAVTWASPSLTIGAVIVAIWVTVSPPSARFVVTCGLVFYAVYLVRRVQEPRLSDSMSQWWFGKVCGFIRENDEKSESPVSVEYSGKAGELNR